LPFDFGNNFVKRNSVPRIFEGVRRAAVEFFNLFWRQCRLVSVVNDVTPNLLRELEAVETAQPGINFGLQSIPREFVFRNRRSFPALEAVHEFIPEAMREFNLFIERELFRGGKELFHGHEFTRFRSTACASRGFVIRHSSFAILPRMIPREILKKIRQIEIRTNRIVTETLAGQYHSVFKGQGMNFDEVREYQPGDDVRAIDWNVTARMNHPFIKKFVEERELTLMLVVDVSGSGLFGSRDQSKRELAAEIASVLAFSAIRNNDKVGLILFSDEVEKFIPPRKGRSHVLRVIREVLFYEPKRRGTDLNAALEFLMHVTRHRAVAVVISDFIGAQAMSGTGVPPVRSKRPGTRLPETHGQAARATPRLRPQMMLLESLAQASFTMLKQANRRHDVVAVQITDRYELELPALGRLVLKDAETGEVVEINTGDARKRSSFIQRQARALADTARLFRSAGIDSIQLRTDQPYGAGLAKFFETREKRRLRG